jgi:hypothetical protein
MSGYRLGDVVDDYCTRCHLLLSHDVAILSDGAIVQTTCRTCFTTHEFKSARVPRKPVKKSETKASLMDQVLRSMPELPGLPPPPQAKPKRDLWADLERVKQKSATPESTRD